MMGRLPLDLSHTPADMQEAIEMLRRAKEELDLWESRWKALRWCHSGCGEDRNPAGGPGIGGGGFLGL